MTLPHVAFNRRIGEFSAIHTDTDGKILSDEDWHGRRESMLPSTDDNLFIASLMHTSLQPGSYAGWIAPPRHGVDNMPGDFEYVQLAS
jgi:benzoyl-CoA 2,3-dioxygenase component B